MLTPFGKAVRKIRIDHNMKPSTMAERLDVKPAFLTSVETGRKSVPADFPERIAALFAALHDVILAQLRETAEQSKTVYKLAVGHGAREQQREIAAIFAREFSDLTDEQINQIKKVVGEKA